MLTFLSIGNNRFLINWQQHKLEKTTQENRSKKNFDQGFTREIKPNNFRILNKLLGCVYSEYHALIPFKHFHSIEQFRCFYIAIFNQKIAQIYHFHPFSITLVELYKQSWRILKTFNFNILLFLTIFQMAHFWLYKELRIHNSEERKKEGRILEQQ